ncbi:hypothetical protein [Stieleria varia]|uniref:Uncharacterized protein n=1 Tax=Stieleria varia TaxID=2528005 RepID=A0A5C6APT0_9BACT|nr:hypothetical protein [Stieleria varia]TWU01229.1 hypothetical protein Pla52n_46020 [Stieleria varia]
MSSEQTTPKPDETKTRHDLGYWNDFVAQIELRSDAELSQWIDQDLAELENRLAQFVSPNSRLKTRG